MGGDRASRRTQNKARFTPDDETQGNKWANAFTPDAEWSKTDLADVVYWFRQVIGITFGVIWGVIPLTGFFPIIVYAFLNAFLLYLYYAKFLRVDEEEFGRWELLSEGFAPSFALFMVAWITCYSYLFF